MSNDSLALMMSSFSLTFYMRSKNMCTQASLFWNDINNADHCCYPLEGSRIWYATGNQQQLTNTCLTKDILKDWCISNNYNDNVCDCWSPSTH